MGLFDDFNLDTLTKSVQSAASGGLFGSKVQSVAAKLTPGGVTTQEATVALNNPPIAGGTVGSQVAAPSATGGVMGWVKKNPIPSVVIGVAAAVLAFGLVKRFA